MQSAITALNARQETHGRVYFYDTPALDLLSKGVIIRFRDRAEADLTVKLRPLPGDKLVDPSGVRDDYRCDVDVNDGVETESFSVMNKDLTAKAPLTGEAIFQELSPGAEETAAGCKG